jgi:hypothetical protein
LEEEEEDKEKEEDSAGWTDSLSTTGSHLNTRARGHGLQSGIESPDSTPVAACEFPGWREEPETLLDFLMIYTPRDPTHFPFQRQPWPTLFFSLLFGILQS